MARASRPWRTTWTITRRTELQAGGAVEEPPASDDPGVLLAEKAEAGATGTSSEDGALALRWT